MTPITGVKMDSSLSLLDFVLYGWDGGIRTPECWDQNPVPYHLATSQYDERGAVDDYSIDRVATQAVVEAPGNKPFFRKRAYSKSRTSGYSNL